jgi:hypothetical protein
MSIKRLKVEKEEFYERQNLRHNADFSCPRGFVGIGIRCRYENDFGPNLHYPFSRGSKT